MQADVFSPFAWKDREKNTAHTKMTVGNYLQHRQEHVVVHIGEHLL